LIEDCEGYVAAEDVVARVDSPSLSTSLKDGYALRAEDMTVSEDGQPAALRVIGTLAAGQEVFGVVQPNTAMRVLTGAPLPPQADTIVAEEFTCLKDGRITVTAPTEKGRNILLQGSDTAVGAILLRAGQLITPGRIGILAAGGHQSLRVFQKPSIAVIATGDELLLPGQPLEDGKLYASNMLTLHAWCCHFGFKTMIDVVGDDAAALHQRLSRAAAEQDAMVTSGGAWGSDKDLMARVLKDMGWEKIYHRVRLGPGKAVGFGLLNDKPVFILPGGPPSNLVAFLELALPGLLRLCGHRDGGLRQVKAKLAQSVSGQADWTQAIFGNLLNQDDGLVFRPHDGRRNRLHSMAEAQGLLLIPEGVSTLHEQENVSVQILR
jgi:molybdopterin molybdotransferase